MPNRVFLDTNCFLHLRDLQDLPWRDLFPGSSVDIMVASVVIDELDRLKIEKSGRIRDRARAALKSIEGASAEPQMRLKLRETPQTLWLVVDQGPAIDWSLLPRLDATRADDQLVAAALVQSNDEPTTLLSYDSGPLIRARMAGLPAFKSPETLALPPQRDKTEQEVVRLQKELEEARATRPILSAGFVDLDSDGVLRLPIPRLPPLPHAIQNRLMEAIRLQFPQVNLSVRPFPHSMSLGGVSREDAERYYTDYEKFLERWLHQFTNLPELMATALRFGEVRYEVHNDSPVTAGNVRVALSALPDFTQYGSRADMEKVGGALPRIFEPKAPKTFPDYLSSSALDPSLFRKQRWDPTTFYWLDRPEGEGVAIKSCAEFRPEQVHMGSIYLAGPIDTGGEVVIDISATNLSKPIRLSVPFAFERRNQDWTCPAVLRRLPAIPSPRVRPSHSSQVTSARSKATGRPMRKAMVESKAEKGVWASVGPISTVRKSTTASS